MKNSAKKNAYNIEYNATHIKQIKFNFSLQYDADILAKLDSVPNKQGYIKELIRADIAAHSTAQNAPEQSYHIKPEYLSMWGEDATEDTVIDQAELERLATEWGAEIDDLKDQLIPD